MADAFIKKDDLVEGLTATEVDNTLAQKERLQALVGDREARAHGQQAIGTQHPIGDSGGFRSAIEPGRHFEDVLGETAFDCRSIRFAKHAASVPASDLVVVGRVLGLVADLSKDGGKGNELRLAGQIENAVNLLLAQEFRRAFKSGTGCVAMLLVGGQRQIKLSQA